MLPSGLSELRILASLSLPLDWTNVRSGTVLLVLTPWPVRIGYDASPAVPASVYVEADVARVVLTDTFLLAGAHSARSFGRRSARPLSVSVFRNHTPAVVRSRLHGRRRMDGGRDEVSGGGGGRSDAGDDDIEVSPGHAVPSELPASLVRSTIGGRGGSDSDGGGGGGGSGAHPPATAAVFRRRREHPGCGVAPAVAPEAALAAG